MSSIHQKQIKHNKKIYKEEYKELKNRGYSLKDRNDCIMYLHLSDWKKIEFNKYIEIYMSDLEFPRPKEEPIDLQFIINLWVYDKQEYKKYNDEDYFNHYDDMTN